VTDGVGVVVESVAVGGVIDVAPVMDGAGVVADRFATEVETETAPTPDIEGEGVSAIIPAVGGDIEAVPVAETEGEEVVVKRGDAGEEIVVVPVPETAGTGVEAEGDATGGDIEAAPAPETEGFGVDSVIMETGGAMDMPPPLVISYPSTQLYSALTFISTAAPPAPNSESVALAWLICVSVLSKTVTVIVPSVCQTTSYRYHSSLGTVTPVKDVSVEKYVLPVGIFWMSSDGDPQSHRSA